jgi:hypothetical protein
MKFLHEWRSAILAPQLLKNSMRRSSMTQKCMLSLAVVGILEVVAIVGCNRSPQPVSVVNPAVDAASANTYPAANNYTTVEEPAYGMRPPVRMVTPQQVVVEQPPPPQAEVEPQRPYNARRRYYADRYEERRPRVVTKERSFGHSAAIVGGSAGGGAVIGALAGGGKGAGIGALAGGAGGFIYDRLTHKKHVVVEER